MDCSCLYMNDELLTKSVIKGGKCDLNTLRLMLKTR